LYGYGSDCYDETVYTGIVTVVEPVTTPVRLQYYEFKQELTKFRPESNLTIMAKPHLVPGEFVIMDGDVLTPYSTHYLEKQYIA
jgi:hypothetical protein